MFTKTIIGVRKPAGGMYVWSDGARTLPPQKARVDVVRPYQHWIWEHPATGQEYDVVLYRAESVDGDIVTGRGDSGGAVITSGGDGNDYHMKAVGIISGWAGINRCGPPNPGPNDDACATGVLFTDLAYTAARRNLDFTR